jgi:Uncharacterised nucleotidyltransferase/Transglutaminase-like superfamily
MRTGGGEAPAPAPSSDLGQIEAYLTGRQSEPPPPEVLRRFGLAGYAYTRLPTGHTVRAALRPDHTAALFDHLNVRSTLRTLLAAWQQAGIVVLLFKGFQLSEFVYPSPGQRPYGDIDLMLPLEQAALASQIATDLGWTEPWNRERSLTPFHHELMTLLSPDGRVQLDVHERLVHNLLPQVKRQTAISSAVWAQARRHDWDGLEVLLPTPEDAALVGLVLNRCWGDDSWRIAAHDLPDFEAIVGRSELTLKDLQRRAEELGCSRTLALFLRLCDPFQRHLKLKPRSRPQLLAWGLRIMPERGLLVAEHLLSKGWVTASKLQDMARELPGVLRVLWILRGGVLRREHSLSDLTRRALPGLPPRAGRKEGIVTSAFQIQRVIRGVHFVLNLLRVRPAANCLPRALAITASLRRMGLPAVFVSGVRRAGHRVLSHAWVELDGQPLFDATEAQTAHLYTPNYHAPSGLAGTGRVELVP